ncbi:hypothetical protein FACS1894192_01610 [Bacilli bacterium]|nr:hypothetical protein FACS1894192_01610 [Bacilli bacterium]
MKESIKKFEGLSLIKVILLIPATIIVLLILLWIGFYATSLFYKLFSVLLESRGVIVIGNFNLLNIAVVVVVATVVV